MCDFQVGDKVVCIWPGPWRRSGLSRWHRFWRRINNRDPIMGATYTVTTVRPCADATVGIDVDHAPAPCGFLYNAILFRKVQPRNLSAWLKTQTVFEEPKRAPTEAV